MLPKVVVVGLPSQSNACSSCGSSLTFFSPLCNHCQLLQPFPPSPPNFFEVFGLEPKLEVDETALRISFYEFSKNVHPDSYALRDPAQKMHASRWSTFINRAYQTLKDSDSRTEYLLELFSHCAPSERRIPTDLAEAYFELQERLLEDGAQEALEIFNQRLVSEEESCQKEWNQIAKSWSQTPNQQELISQLQSCWDKRKYLASLRSNLEKQKKDL